MGLNRKMRLGETLYLQRGDEIITIHINEFTQGDRAEIGAMIKVSVIVDAPKSWDITHHTKDGTSMKGKNQNANDQWTSQEEAARKARQEAIYSHKSDTPY